MREIRTEIEIDTIASDVWKILTELDKYVAWNPFIKEAEGRVEQGNKLRVHIAPPGTTGRTFWPRITRLVENSELRWEGYFILPSIFKGEHIFEIVPVSQDRVKFIQRENFSGLLVPFIWKGLLQSTTEGFNEMNRAVKERAESKP